MSLLKRYSMVASSCALVVSGLLVVTTTANASGSWHVLSKAHATGQYALASTDAEITSPSKIQVLATSKPRASGLVQWPMECTKKSGTLSKTTGKKTVELPGAVKVKVPSSFSSCILAANVELGASGTVYISIETSN
jgi:hypothetical protein